MSVVRFYNRRGTAEQWIKEGKNSVWWTKLSCWRFKENEVWLRLFARILGRISRLCPASASG
jgi:hypothetical protein